MSAPATEDLRELARELELAAERGVSLTFSVMQEQFGLGHHDLEVSLDLLREHGQAVEESPGEWRGPTMDELDTAAKTGTTPAADDGRVRVRVDEGDAAQDEAATAGRDRLREMDGQRAPAASSGWIGEATAAGPDVRLTRGIAEKMGDEALGQLVKAGLEDADGDTFVLEVWL